jgi:hypothetical protein
MATALERLEASIPNTRSSASLMKVSSLTAQELLAQLPAGDVRDRFAAVVPNVRSSAANTTFSQRLGVEVADEINAA